MEKKNFDRIVKICENNGWIVHGKHDDEYVELEKYSPAGEDYSFTAEVENFISDVQKEHEYFDADEHATMWYGQNCGEPSSLRELLDDAEAIKKMIGELYNALTEGV